MGVINSLSITNFENVIVPTEVNRTRLKVNFNVSFNHEGSEDPTQIYRNLYGYKVEIMGYPDPNSRDRSAHQVFNFERTVYRWVPNRNRFGGTGFWGDGRIVRTITDIYDLSGDPSTSGPLEINRVTYANQEVLSQKIEMDLLDVNPAIPVVLPPFFGGGTFYAKEEDQIFARISIVDKRTRTVISHKDSMVLRGYFGTVEA